MGNNPVTFGRTSLGSYPSRNGTNAHDHRSVAYFHSPSHRRALATARTLLWCVRQHEAVEDRLGVCPESR